MLDVSAHIIEFKAIFVFTAFLVFFTWEHTFPKVIIKSLHSRILKNLSFWPINILASITVILPITYLAEDFAIWHRPLWFNHLIIDIFILDLFIYWWHRANHEIPFLWRFHQVHHLDQFLDTTSAIRFHFGEIIFSALARAIIMIIFAIPFTSIIVFETALMIATLFHHSNIRLPKRFESLMSYTFITPAIHWVHHHTEWHDTNANYGSLLSIWDRLFNSRSMTKRYASMPIGIPSKVQDIALGQLLILPFKGGLSN